MTNREKLIKTNEYDTLLRMQKNLEQTNIVGDTPCIMNTLGESNIIGRCAKYGGKCEMCIAEWLSEKAS